jgi:D-alanyl-D-alanine dipeptidase
MVISTLRRIVFFGSVCIFLGSAGGGCGNQEKRQKPVFPNGSQSWKKAWRTREGNGGRSAGRRPTDTSGQKEDSGTERRMRQLGLVDIGEVDPTIAVHLVYATSDNFAGKVLYQDIRKAFLLPEAAGRLAEAQRKLKLLRPELMQPVR